MTNLPQAHRGRLVPTGLHRLALVLLTSASWAVSSGEARPLGMDGRDITVGNAGHARSECIDPSDYMHLRGSVGLSDLPRLDWRKFKVKAAPPYAYVLRNWEFSIVDVADPDEPRRRGSIDFDFAASHLEPNLTGLAIVGPYVYLTAQDSLRIMDVSDPDSPTVVRSLPIPSGGIAVSGSYVYLVDDGLDILDASNPAEPVLVNSVPLPGVSSHEIAVSGTFAYVLQDSGMEGFLAILRMATPTSASLVGRVIVGSTDRSVSIDIHGDYAYVGNRETDFWGTGGSIVDVSNPAAPTVVRTDDFDFFDAVFVDEVFYQVAGGRLRTVDVSGSAYGTRIGEIGIPVYAGAVDVVSGFAYTIGWPGFQVVDVSNPATAGATGAVTLPEGPWPHSGIVTSNGLAYVGAGSFSIVDISDPETPTRLGGVDDVWATDVGKSGPFAFVTNVPNGTPTDVKVIDVSNPASPRVIRSIDAPGERIAIDGAIACVVGHDQGLQVLDVSDPNSASVVGHAPLQTYYKAGVAMDGSYAFVALEIGDSSFLLVFDLSVPASPALVGQIEVPEIATEVVVGGGYAYLVTGWIFVVLDI